MELRTGVSVEAFGIFLFITTSPAECRVSQSTSLDTRGYFLWRKLAQRQGWKCILSISAVINNVCSSRCVAHAHTGHWLFKQTSSICGSYVWYKCKIIPQLQQMLVFSVFNMYKQQSIHILYPNNVQSAGELNILLYKFSLNPPYFFVLL